MPNLSNLQPSPPNTALGGPAFTLALLGTGFVPDTQVLWKLGTNVHQVPVIFVSSKKILLRISAADIQNAGTAKVGVSNPGQGSGPTTINFPIQ